MGLHQVRFSRSTREGDMGAWDVWFIDQGSITHEISRQVTGHIDGHNARGQAQIDSGAEAVTEEKEQGRSQKAAEQVQRRT